MKDRTAAGWFAGVTIFIMAVSMGTALVPDLYREEVDKWARSRTWKGANVGTGGAVFYGWDGETLFIGNKGRFIPPVIQYEEKMK